MNGGVAVAGDRHASRSGNFSVRQTENLSTERIQRALMLNAGMRSPLKCGAFSFSSRRLSEKTRTYPWLRSASPSSPPKNCHRRLIFERCIDILSNERAGRTLSRGTDTTVREVEEN
jgi:hypothetical protein